MSQKQEDTGEVHRCDQTSTRMMQKLLLCYIMQMICMIMIDYVCLPHLSYLFAV